MSAGFGAFWGLEGSSGFHGNLAALLAALVGIVTLGLLAAAMRLRGLARRLPDAGRQRGRNPFTTLAYRLAVLFEVLAIPLAYTILHVTQRDEYFIPVLALVVGLHFFGLVPAFRSWRFAAVGGAMCLVAGLALLFPQHTTVNDQPIELWPALVGFGCALILWGAATQALLWIFTQVRRRDC